MPTTAGAVAYDKVEGADFDVHDLACEKLARDRQFVPARQCLDVLLGQAKNLTVRAELAYRRAEWLERLDQPHAARAEFLAVAKAYPSEEIAPRARFRAARLLEFDLTEPVAATREYQALIDDQPNSAAAVEALSHLSGRLDEKAFVVYLRQFADRPVTELTSHVLKRLADILIAQMETAEEAGKLFDRWAELVGAVHRVDGYYFAGQAYARAHQATLAVDRLQKLLATESHSILPGDVNSAYLDDGRLLLASIYRDQLGDKKVARRLLEELISDQPDSRLVDDALMALAALALSDGDRTTAAKDYGRLLLLRPDSRYVSSAKAFRP